MMRRPIVSLVSLRLCCKTHPWKLSGNQSSNLFHVFEVIQTRLLVFGLFIFSLPWLLADHYAPWDSFHSEALSFLAVFSLLSGLLVSRTGIVTSRFICWIVLAGFLPWLQHLIGISPFVGDAFLASLYFSGLLSAVLFGFTAASDQADQQVDCLLGLAHAFWIAALISAAIGLVQWLQLTESLGIYIVQTGKGARALGNLGQPNQLATFLLMGIAALTYVYERTVIGKWTSLLAVSFVTMVLVLTQSRAGVVSVLVIAAFLIWKQQFVLLRLSRNAILWWVTGFILGTLCLPYLNQELMLGDARSLIATESVSERWIMWKQVLYAIGQAPWLGYGWNQTPAAGAIGAVAFAGASPYTYAHNIFLDLMAWCGIPIGLFFAGGMGYWLVTRVRLSNRPDAVFAMACLLPIAVHSLLEFPFAYSYFLIAAGFMMGIVEAGHAPVKTIRLGAIWLWGFLVVWTIVGCCMIYEYFLIEEDFRIVRFENLNLGSTPTTYEVPQPRVLSHMAAMLKSSRLPLAPNMSKTDVENLRKVSDRFTYGAIRCRYGMALGLNGDPLGAAHQLTIIGAVHGEAYHDACKTEISRLVKEKHSQLGSVAAH